MPIRFALVVAPLALAACASTPLPASTSATAPTVASSAPAPSATSVKPATRWSYDGDLGPAHWGDLDPSFAACSHGTVQSPVNLPAATRPTEKAPTFPTWAPVPLRVVNNGHSIQVDDTAASSFVLDGTTYAMKNFHFHSPSEHTVDGRSFEAEMHFVHKSADGKIAVVAILFDRGRPNDLLAPLFAAMPASASGDVATRPETIDVQTLLPKTSKLFRYSGSLTAPPCTEGVTWLVVVPDAPPQLGDAQIAQLRAALKGATNRPLQPLGGRTIVEVAP
jgi:carbonic anhydrase